MAENKPAVTPPARKKTHRSPKYPSMNLGDALVKARMVYDAERRVPTTEAVVMSHMGYQNPNTGPAGRAVSALKQYGLLEQQADGLYRISEPCFRYFELPENDPERQKILREAAVGPPIFKELLEQYPDQIPSDATLRSHLILEKNFNSSVVDDLIRAFRTTINLAKPSEGGYTPTDAGGKPEGQSKPAGAKPMQEQPTPPATTARNPTPPPSLVQFYNLDGTPAVPAKTTELAFKLSRGSEARVVIYGEASQEAIEKLTTLLDLQKDTFPTREELERPQARSATWKNKDHDQPVTVIGDLGNGPDGKHYLKIAESDTGVPEDDLEFEDAQAKGAA
jgi:hypothetical protein